MYQFIGLTSPEAYIQSVKDSKIELGEINNESEKIQAKIIFSRSCTKTNLTY